MISTSVPQTPTATASTRTDPSRRSGSGMSSRQALPGLCGSTVMAFIVSYSLRCVGAPGAHPDGIETSARCDEERLAIDATEGHIGGPFLVGHGNVIDLPALRVEHHHAVARQVDMAVSVQRHPVGALFDHERLAGQASITC